MSRRTHEVTCRHSLAAPAARDSNRSDSAGRANLVLAGPVQAGHGGTDPAARAARVARGRVGFLRMDSWAVDQWAVDRCPVGLLAAPAARDSNRSDSAGQANLVLADPVQAGHGGTDPAARAARV
ncbi:MAG TPA: hypothetical protein PKK57_02980, partial [Verrucomicrobiota bacterium]|nr:hypothetical protein [Verrucomicrobiota bacterium]